MMGFSKLKMTYCVLDIETRDIIDTRSVVGIPNNYPFRDAYKVPASVIRYDYENWPSLMPVEKISMEKERMLLKFAPKDVENTTLEAPTKTQSAVKDGKQDQVISTEVPNVNDVKVERDVNESSTMHVSYLSLALNFQQSYDELWW